MAYYIFKSQIFSVFLSLNFLTVVTFEEKVHDYVGGAEGDFKIYELNKGKSLVFEAKKKGFSRNFISFLKDTKYHFNLSYNDLLAPKDIEIRSAKKCTLFNLIKETSAYQLFECPKSLFFINKIKRPIKVNELIISSRKYISKGPPVFIDGNLIYINGRVL